MASVLRVRIFENKINELLNAPNGQIGLYMANVGRQAAGIARRLAPRRSGALQASIDSKIVPTARGMTVEVTAGVPYADYVHQGTRPHSIGSPVFIEGVGWRYIGLSPSGAGKIHPGTKPDPFLLEAVRQLGLDARRT